MRKIKLGVENLRVESFTTDASDGNQGTVLANAKTYDPECKTYFPVDCGSAIDACPSSPHAATLPCNGCVETDLC
ncbi:MAG TPA: hypothetical protein VFS20_10690 [Longimicrobium sp.]|nr:hypothetical protein [Longimicrobium sp.]